MTAPTPERILDTLNAYQRSAALRGAIELDLFTVIGSGKRDVDAIAHACGTDRRATRILCDFLVVCGFLSKQSDQYGLTEESACFLDRQSPAYFGSVARFLHSDDLMAAYRDVAELTRRGTTLLRHAGTTAPDYEGWVEFARSMTPMMRRPAAFIGELAAAHVPGPIRVLDVAAGHGLFGIAVAQRNETAAIVALDWGEVLAVAEENARAAGLASRYSLLPGDAHSVDWAGSYDLILLTNFLHHYDRATCVSLFRKVAACLRPNGLAITLEFIPNEDRVTPPNSAGFAFMMLGTTPAGDAYTFAEYQAMAREAGLLRNDLHPVPQSPQHVILSRH